MSGKDKKEAIFEATINLVAKNGFHGTSMSKVAKEAGVSAGIIYHYFESKDELMIELYKEVKKNWAKRSLEVYDPKLPLAVQIRKFFEISFKYNLANPPVTIFMQQFSVSPYYTPCLHDEVKCYMDEVAGCFQRAQEEEILKEFPDQVWGTFILDIPASLSQKQEMGLLDLTDEVVEQVIDAVWAAVRK